MPGEIARLMTCQWTSDKQNVVLEVPDEKEGSKATYDSARCTWAQLLRELEEGKVVDPTINNHDLLAPVSDSGIKLRILKNVQLNHEVYWFLHVFGVFYFHEIRCVT